MEVPQWFLVPKIGLKVFEFEFSVATCRCSGAALVSRQILQIITDVSVSFKANSGVRKSVGREA